MKKITMGLFAMAAMAIGMTSCNKEENVKGGENILFTVEENDVTNNVKFHIESDGVTPAFDENDRVFVLDGNRNAAIYKIQSNQISFFERYYGNFDATNGSLTAYFPHNIANQRYTDRCVLPAVQYTNAGELQNMPMYGQGTIEKFQWRNLCGVLKLRVTSKMPIDSIKLTADKYLNGNFWINMNNNTTPLSYRSEGGYGTKSKTLRFNQPLENAANQDVYIYIPGNTYNVFEVTMYSNGQQYVKRANSTVTIDRTHMGTMIVNLTDATFEDAPAGALSHEYAINENGDAVVFAQGNLQYVGGSGANHNFWRFADNQFDCFAKDPQMNKTSTFDRDMFAWGANRYMNKNGRETGNAYQIWNTTPGNAKYLSGYTYYNGTELDGANEWGNNKIANGGNTANSGWRTLTEEEMDYVMENNNTAMVTLSFVNVQGMMLYPADYTLSSTTLDKAAYYEAVDNGAVFFPVKYTRAATARTYNEAFLTGTSMYWFNTTDTEDNAAAMTLTATTNTTTYVAKNAGAYVRLVKDVE